MKTSNLLCSLVLSFGAHSAFAQTTVQCEEHPKTEWRTEAELQDKLVKEGWTVRRVEESCTCFQVFGTSPDGKRVAASFDPKTFERADDK